MPPKQTPRRPLADRRDIALATEEPNVEILAYNYDQIDEEHRQVVIDAAVDIKRNVRRAHESLIAIGKRLLEVKEFLPHGQFGNWIETEFSLSEIMAQRMMNAATVYGANPSRVTGFSDSAIYLLVAPSMPEEVRAEIEAEAKATGKPATRKRIEERKREHKRQQQPEPEPAQPEPPQTPPDVAQQGYSIEYHETAQQYRWARHNAAGGANYGPLRDTAADAIQDVWENAERGVKFYEPGPAEQPDRNAVRRERMEYMRSLYQETIASFDEYGDLTGNYTRTLAAHRDLERMITDLENNLEALSK